MADSDTPNVDQPTENYRFTGMKESGEKVDRIILEGSSHEPVRWIDLGGEGELTESEVTELRASGHKLSKVKSDGSTDDDDTEGEAPKVETRAEQQKAQAASTGNPPDKSSGKKS